jgi:nitrogenase molybdenum-iron protein alpha chain
MAVNLNISDCETRELRLNSITGYDGTLQDMAKKGCEGCLKNRQRCFSTVSASCNHTHAIDQLAGLDSTVVIDHAPIGCSGAQIGYTVMKNRMGELPGKVIEHAKVFSTDIRESDTVFGALDKLRDTIRAAYERHHPREIYVVTSCTSGIIGEDVYSVVREMEEELGVPIGYAAGEGMRSKIWATGFDAYCHAVAKVRLKTPEKKRNIINYVGFAARGRDYIDPLFAKLGFEVNYLTGSSTIEDFAKATEAIATWGQCGAQSSYLCGVLEKEYGIKYFQSHLPYGGIGFERFFRDVAKFIGQEELAEEILKEEREKYLGDLEKIRAQLKGKKAVLALGASFAYEYTRILGELGVEVLHAVAYHYDPKLDNNSDEKVAAAADAQELGLDVETSVNDAQQMETALVVQKYKPDFIISRAHEASPWAVRKGIPALEVKIGLSVMGYRALVEIGYYIAKELRNANFVRKLAARYESPFTEKYEELEPFTFYQEA